VITEGPGVVPPEGEISVTNRYVKDGRIVPKFYRIVGYWDEMGNRVLHNFEPELTEETFPQDEMFLPFLTDRVMDCPATGDPAFRLDEYPGTNCAEIDGQIARTTKFSGTYEHLQVALSLNGTRFLRPLLIAEAGDLLGETVNIHSILHVFVMSVRVPCHLLLDPDTFDGIPVDNVFTDPPGYSADINVRTTFAGAGVDTQFVRIWDTPSLQSQITNDLKQPLNLFVNMPENSETHTAFVPVDDSGDADLSFDEPIPGLGRTLADRLRSHMAQFAVLHHVMNCRHDEAGRMCSGRGSCRLWADFADQRIIPRPRPFFASATEEDIVDTLGFDKLFDELLRFNRPVRFNLNEFAFDRHKIICETALRGVRQYQGLNVPLFTITSQGVSQDILFGCVEYTCSGRALYEYFLSNDLNATNPCRNTSVDLQEFYDKFSLSGSLPTTLVPGCYCDDGWTGPACDIPQCVPGRPCQLAPFCETEPSRGTWDSFRETCNCDNGYDKDQFGLCTQQVCLEDDLGQPCFGNGECVNSECVCFPGFQPPTCQCPIGTYDAGDGNCTHSLCWTDSVFLDIPGPSENEEVQHFAQLLGRTLVTGSNGLQVDLRNFDLALGNRSSKAVCSGNGACNALGQCECESIAGGRIEGRECASTECFPACQNGNCTEISRRRRKRGGGFTFTNTLQCECEPGWTGPACSRETCPRVNGVPCNGAGKCVAGVCQCSFLFVGCACEVKKTDFCSPPGSQEICSSGGGSCEVVFTTAGVQGQCNCVPTRFGDFCGVDPCTPLLLNGERDVGFDVCGGYPRNTICVPGDSEDEAGQCFCDNLNVFAVDPSGLRLGDHCEVDVRPQCGYLHPNGQFYMCANNGQCLFNKNISDYECVCNPGFTGATCELGTCLVPCLNGECVRDRRLGGFTCACQAVYTKDLDGSCSVDTCGAASPVDGGSRCECPDPTYKPPDCVFKECPPGPGGRLCGDLFPGTPGFLAACQPDGTCVCDPRYYFVDPADGRCVAHCSEDPTKTEELVINRNIGEFSFCRCHPGFDPESGCRGSLCKNGGDYVVETDSCVCDPASGFTGEFCTVGGCGDRGVPVPATSPNSTSTFECSCVFPWTGVGCLAH
jgi:hypothetical protein